MFDHDINVYGRPLAVCGCNPLTGFYRTGKCSTNINDFGIHTVCSVVTQKFLEFSMLRGNDLINPRQDIGFPGLKEGDAWCLCTQRWLEALEAGVAPRVVLPATHRRTLEHIALTDLEFKAAEADILPFR